MAKLTNREVAEYLLQFPDEEFNVFLIDRRGGGIHDQDLDFMLQPQALEMVKQSCEEDGEDPEDDDWY